MATTKARRAAKGGQIMNLFDAVKIATRTKQELALNANCVVAGKLGSILAPTP